MQLAREQKFFSTRNLVPYYRKEEELEEREAVRKWLGHCIYCTQLSWKSFSANPDALPFLVAEDEKRVVAEDVLGRIVLLSYADSQPIYRDHDYEGACYYADQKDELGPSITACTKEDGKTIVTLTPPLYLHGNHTIPGVCNYDDCGMPIEVKYPEPYPDYGCPYPSDEVRRYGSPNMWRRKLYPTEGVSWYFDPHHTGRYTCYENDISWVFRHFKEDGNVRLEALEAWSGKQLIWTRI